MISSLAQIISDVPSEIENQNFKTGTLIEFFSAPKFSGIINGKDGKISFDLKRVQDDKLRTALGKFGLWRKDIRVKYLLEEGISEQAAADCITLLEGEPAPPNIAEIQIHNGTLENYIYTTDCGWIKDLSDGKIYCMALNAVIDDCLQRYLKDDYPISKKSVQFILHWQKDKKVVHSLILTAQERIALNKKYGLTESAIQPALMRQDCIPDYEPIFPSRSTLRTDNIFQVGAVVEGESLIGYKKKYETLRQEILDNRKNILFVGLPKTGKTSLIKKLHTDAKSKNNLIAIFIGTLQEFAAKENPFAAFLFNIAEKLKDELSARVDRDTTTARKFYANFDELQKFYVSRDHGKRFQNSFKHLFKVIKDLNMHVLLSVDEFESAEKIFKDTKYLAVFDGLTNPKYAINTVFISNRQKKSGTKNFDSQSSISVYGDILKLLGENFSKKYDIRMTIQLKGFSEGDIKIIFNILRTDYGIRLSDVQVEQIRYYAGRFPYIYSAFCHHIVKEKLQSGKNSFDIEKIYKDKIEPILSDYTADLFELLTVEDKLDKINDILFDLKNTDAESKTIKNFCITGYLTASNLNGDRYQALSGHFTDYLRKQYFSQYSSEDIVKNILNMHRLMRIIILKSFRALDADDWKEILKTRFNLGSLDNFIKQNQIDFEERNRAVTLFNALSLKKIFDLIQIFWQPLLKKYFADQDVSHFKKNFDRCARIRDVVCHANENFLKEDKVREIIEVNQFCIETLKLIGKNWQMNSIKIDPFTKKILL